MKLIISHKYWDELKIKLKIEYPQLIDADFLSLEGKEDKMLRMIEYKLRKTKVQMQEIIAKL